MICVPSEDSEQPGHPPSPIRVFALVAHWVAKNLSFLHVDSEDSDQTGRMPRLIWVFAGRTCHFVGFVMRQLKFCFSGSTLEHFTRLKKTVAPGYENNPIRGVSVDNCAARCLRNIAYECQSFQYCAEIGVCTLSRSHPADLTTKPTYHHMCDIFASKYSY